MSILIGFLYFVIFLVSIFLILLVIAQSNKGSDLGLFGGSAEMVFGSGQMHAVAKITMTSAVVLLLSVFLVGFLKSYTSRSLKSTISQPHGVVISDVSTKNSEESGSEVVKGSSQSHLSNTDKTQLEDTKGKNAKVDSLVRNTTSINTSQ